jgi:hypothetical protein
MLEINFKPLPIQVEAWKYLFDKTTSQLLFGGSARVSKTYLLCAWATIYALSYPNIHGAICRGRLSSLKRTTLVTLMEFFRHQGIKEDEHYKFNRADLIITFNNGSKLFFLELYNNPSDPDFERIMSLSLTFAGVDEASEVSNNGINKLQTRLSHMLKEYNLIPKLLIVSNPTKNWLYTDYFKKHIDGELPEYRRVVLGTVEDNTHVDKSYIAQLERLDDITVQRLRYGNWEYDDDDYSLLKFDEITQMFYNHTISGNKYISCDVANLGKDKTIIGVWDGLKLISTYSYDKTDTKEVIRLIKEKMKMFNVNIKNVVIDADGLGVGVSDHLKGCVAFKGGSSPVNKENYRNLRTQCFYKIADLKEQIGLDIKHQEQITNELQSIKFSNIDTDGKAAIISKDKIKETIGKSPDYADMIMMRMVFEIEKPRSKTYVY